MAVLRVNAAADGAIFSAEPCSVGWERRLASLLRDAPASAPVTVLIHGYRFSWRPSTPAIRSWRGKAATPSRHDAQHRLYRTDPVPESRRRRPPLAAWPSELGFSEQDPSDGVCIALGWDARARRKSQTGEWNSFAQVYRTARQASEALFRLAEVVVSATPGRALDCFTHSLGARLVIQAAMRAPDLPLGRIIFLGGAEYAGEVRSMLAAQDAADVDAEFIHIMSRANDFYDGLFSIFAPPPDREGDQPLGAYGLGESHRRWLDLQIDHPEMRARLASVGHAPTRRRERMSHWHVYADHGAMSFYRSLLHDRALWPAERLRALTAPCSVERRWSRLVPGLRLSRHTAAPVPEAASLGT